MTLPPEGSVENYFKYGEVGEEYGYNSAEVKLLLVEDDVLREWLGRQEIETPKEALEIQVKYRDLFNQYEAFGDEDSPQYIEDDDARATARAEFLNTHPDFRDDRNRLEVFKDDGSSELAELNVEYGKIADEFGSNTAEAKLWRLEHPDFTNWAMENWDWEGTEDYKGVEYYQLQIKWRDAQAEYDALETTESREQYLNSHPDFRDDIRRMEALDYEIPKDYIEFYVEYYNLPTAGYDQERFLMEHKDYYKDVWLGALGNQPKDFSKIPTEKEEGLLTYYDALPSGTPRLEARCKDAELDAALVRIRGLDPAYGTYRCGVGSNGS